MKTSHSSAITKLQVLFVITLLIVASASALYSNIEVESAPEPPSLPEDKEEPELADFLVYNLTISPTEAGLRDPVTIAVNVINQGVGAGNYTVVLQVNGANRTNQTVSLLEGETADVEFTVSETMTGTYAVDVGGLIGTYKISVSRPSFTPTTPTDGGGNSELYGLSISTKEAWVGDRIAISINVKNLEDEAKTFTVDLKINNQIR